MAKAPTRLFLGVEKSACGRAWRDRLDERGSARALAIAQRNNVPELLARILAGRGVEPDAVEAYLDPTVKALLPDPDVLTAMPQAAQRLADAVENGENDRDLRRLRRRWRDVVGVARALSAPLRLVADDPYPRPAVRGIWAEYRSDPRARRKGRDIARHRRLRDHELRAAGRSAQARPRRGGDRPSSMRRAIAGRRGAGQSEPARRSVPSQSSRRRRARLRHACRGEPRIAPPRISGMAGAASPTFCRRSTSSRSAPSPMSCRSSASTALSSARV